MNCTSTSSSVKALPLFRIISKMKNIVLKSFHQKVLYFVALCTLQVLRFIKHILHQSNRTVTNDFEFLNFFLALIRMFRL
jgi:hypothetical protein